MATVSQMLAAARSELGYAETGGNRTKFAAEAGHPNGAPWCLTFLVALAKRTGLVLPRYDTAYTPTMAQAFRAAGADFRQPQVGDFAFFDWPDSKHRIQHVGLVESFNSTSVVCIEGNTSAGASGSQDNGDVVARRRRPLRYVATFGRPVYDPEDTVALTEADVMRVAKATRDLLMADAGLGPVKHHIVADNGRLNEVVRNTRELLDAGSE